MLRRVRPAQHAGLSIVVRGHAEPAFPATTGTPGHSFTCKAVGGDGTCGWLAGKRVRSSSLGSRQGSSGRQVQTLLQGGRQCCIYTPFVDSLIVGGTHIVACPCLRIGGLAGVGDAHLWACSTAGRAQGAGRSDAEQIWRPSQHCCGSRNWEVPCETVAHKSSSAGHYTAHLLPPSSLPQPPHPNYSH